MHRYYENECYSLTKKHLHLEGVLAPGDAVLEPYDGTAPSGAEASYTRSYQLRCTKAGTVYVRLISADRGSKMLRLAFKCTGPEEDD